MQLVADVFYRDALDGLPGDVEVQWFGSAEEAVAVLPEADVLLLGIAEAAELEAMVRAGQRLQWVHTRAAGTEKQPLALYHERGITLTNGSGVSSIPMSEYLVMAMLAAAKGLPELLELNTKREWRKPARGAVDLIGTSALLIGFGAVGHAVWERLRAFGVHGTAVRTRAVESNDGLEVVTPDAWRSRLHEFDWVLVMTPLTDATRHMIGKAELAAMKSTAWLFNTSRGGVIDQSALIEALRSDVIGGAFLDVTDPEPLPASSELWELPNAIVTPHCSWTSPAFKRRSVELFLDNLSRWQAGESLRNVVDLAAGY